MTKKNFTLIEMLVVIAIIGILAAMLMPALNSAIDVGRQTSCGNNMRNLYVGIGSYTSDNAGQLVYGGLAWSGHRYWSVFITGKQSNFWSTFKDGTEYVAPGPIFGCPSNPTYGKYAKGFASADRGSRAYGMSFCGAIRSKTIDKGNNTKAFIYNLNTTPKPSKYLLLSDSLSMWDGAKRMTASVPNYTDNLYSSRIHLLHANEMANNLFFDGHLEARDAFAINESPSNHRHFFSSDCTKLPILPAN